jgi:glycosyltransferase involved in cell wall biosynthesis/peptidoglycan/xylan/chitin deacetylase (PgdA/CDA1 family)
VSPRAAPPDRLGVYVDARFGLAAEGTLTADIPFVRFANELGRHFAGVTFFGRRSTHGGHHDLRPVPWFVALPDYDRVSPAALVAAAAGTARAMWRGLRDVDAVLVFGPHPYAILLAAMAAARGRRVALGVRQDSRAYFAHRKGPTTTPWVGVAIRAMDRLFRITSHFVPAVVVGGDLARHYGDSANPPIVTVFSQLRTDQLIDGRKGSERESGALLTVGRIEPEKNPTLLVDAMVELQRRYPDRFHLRWIGSGRAEPEVRRLIAEKGLDGSVTLEGYQPFGDALVARYRAAAVFVHVSHTEGVPQVLFEALGSGATVVATDVGGVRRALDGGRAGYLVPPGDRDALVDAIVRADADRSGTRRRRGDELAAAATLDAAARTLADELVDRWRPRSRRMRLAGVAGRIGFGRVMYRVGRTDRLTVVAYHRIGEAAQVAPFDDGLRSATPSAFAWQMEWLADRFNVIGLNDVRAILCQGHPAPRLPALVTFDDGYRDNYEHALPVLARLGLPAVVFVATDAIDSRQPHWWDVLAASLRAAPSARLTLPLIGARDLRGPANRLAVHAELRAELKRVPADVRAEAVDALTAMFAPRRGWPDHMMTWDEARAMNDAGIAIEPHTRSHPILTTLSSAAVEAEVRGSTARIAAEIGTAASAFAYPNGDNDPQVRNAVQRCGVDLAFTLSPGPIAIDRARNARYAVPRIAIDASDTPAIFAMKVGGGLGIARRRPV